MSLEETEIPLYKLKWLHDAFSSTKFTRLSTYIPFKQQFSKSNMTAKSIPVLIS